MPMPFTPEQLKQLDLVIIPPKSPYPPEYASLWQGYPASFPRQPVKKRIVLMDALVKGIALAAPLSATEEYYLHRNLNEAGFEYYVLTNAGLRQIQLDEQGTEITSLGILDLAHISYWSHERVARHLKCSVEEIAYVNLTLRAKMIGTPVWVEAVDLFPPQDGFRPSALCNYLRDLEEIFVCHAQDWAVEIPEVVFADPVWTKVKELSISDTSPPLLLGSCTQLQKLWDFRNFSVLAEIKEGGFAHLIDLRLHNVRFLQNLLKFLMACPRLQNLDISFTEDIAEEFLAPEKMNFVELTKIWLAGANIPLTIVMQLINAAPVLKELSLYGEISISRPVTLSKSNLTTMSFTFVVIPSSVFEILLKATPKLKWLIARDSRITDEGSFVLEKACLPWLEEIYFTGTVISLPILRELLNAASRVQKLSFVMANFREESFKDCVASELIEVNFIGCTISVALLKDFFAACPQLKKIDLSRTEITIIDLSLLHRIFDECSFPQIEEIDFSYSSVNLKVILYLIRACPNLKCLRLGEGPVLEFDAPNPLKRPSPEESQPQEGKMEEDEATEETREPKRLRR